MDDNLKFVADAAFCLAAYLTFSAVAMFVTALWSGRGFEMPWVGVWMAWDILFIPAPVIAIVAAAAYPLPRRSRRAMQLLAMMITVAVMEALLLVGVHLSAVLIALPVLCFGIALLFKRANMQESR